MTRVVLLVVAALCAPPVHPPCARAAQQPDFVLLVADDLGERELAEAHTPNLDALRAQSVSFPRFYTQTNCSPTRCNLLAGQQPLPAFGIGTLVRPASQGGLPYVLPASSFTIAEALAGVGYHTAFFGKWHVSNDVAGPPPGVAPGFHGFDTWRAMSAYGVGNGYGGGTEGVLPWWQRIDDGVYTQELVYNTSAIRQAFQQWWSTTPSPRFALVCFNAPHEPLHVPPPHLLSAPSHATDARSLFLLMVQALDSCVGGMLASVDFSSTYVAFLGDNGSPVLAAPNPLNAKGSMYDGGVSPPMFVAGPGVAAGRTACALVQVSDFWATLAELGQVPVEPPADSISFAGSLVDSQSPGRRRYAVAAYRRPNGFDGPFDLYRRMACSATHKLILDDPDGDGPLPAVETLLDFAEHVVVAPEIADELEQVLASGGF